MKQKFMRHHQNKYFFLNKGCNKITKSLVKKKKVNNRNIKVKLKAH